MNHSKHRTFRHRLSLEQLEARVLLTGDLFRSVNGADNNIDHPEWGETETQLIRLTAAAYADDLSTPAGPDRPSARAISNAVHAQAADVANDRLLTDYVWAWGQFIDHDLDLTDPASPSEPFHIAVPQGDPQFDPAGTGVQEIGLNRAVYDPSTGSTVPREQINEITAYLDASNVYGSDETRAAALRTFQGGQLRTGVGGTLPYNDAGLPNAMGASNRFYLAGDVRANENVMLSSMHTLFVREHNRLAAELAATEFVDADLDDSAVDEEIYQRARTHVGGLMQSITYHEFLPALLGAGAVPAYSDDGGYNPTVNAGIANEFSAAAFRVGHTMLSPNLQLADSIGNPSGAVELRDAFFHPELLAQTGVEPLLRGAATQLMQEVDPLVIDDVRNFLFGPPGAGGFDLASLNIQRGRDHGLPAYNEARAQLGLGAVSDFSDISSNASVVARLQAVYDNVDEVDFWVGGLAEDHLAGRSLGQLFSVVLEDQFYRTRAGDRFYYENALSPAAAAEISNTRLSDVIARNTAAQGLQENVFLAESVFYYRPDVGSTMDQLSVVEQGGFLQIQDRFGNPLMQQPIGTVDAIVLEGPVDGARVELHVHVAALPEVPIAVGGFETLSVNGLTSSDYFATSFNTLTINQSIEIAMQSIENLAIDGVRSVTRSLGALGDGVAIHDHGQLVGYLLHSTEPVSERFEPAPPYSAAEHLVMAYYINGVWHYDSGVTLTPFLPVSTDTLLAEIVPGNGTATVLSGLAGDVDGIRGGYLTSDLSVSASNALATGRLAVSGSEFSTFAVDVYRSIDGADNNQANHAWGEAETQLLRITSSAYGDGLATPAGADRPSARAISNQVVAQTSSHVNDRGLTDFVWAWGQFIDHDLDLTDPADPTEPFDIPVPAGDFYFDPAFTGEQTISLGRAVYDPATGISTPREQLNEITAYLDASNVYGSDPVRAAALRTFSGGQLAVSAGNLLPFNVDRLPNAMSDSASFFLAGDVRANENAMLTTMHTVFLREHNRLAAELAATEYAGYDLTDPAVDEAIYQQSREVVGALIQSITYNEFLPALLGAGAIPSYQDVGGYNPSVNAGVSNEFSAGAFRVGHTMLSSNLQHLDSQGNDLGAVRLLDAFFNPQVVQSKGIDGFLQGAAAQLMQEIDPLVIDDVRNFLFGPPGAGGFDLASLNIQRGRDHGLPSYNEARQQLGLGAASSFADVSSDPSIAQRLASVYDTVDDVDFWIGGLAEDHLPGRSLGSLFSAVLEDQFYRSRVGDRFYFEHALTPEMVEDVSNTRLSDVLHRNASLGTLQDNVFYVDSVFHYRPEFGSGASELRLAVEGEDIVLRNGAGDLVQRQAFHETTSIVIEGAADGAPLHVKLDLDGLQSAPVSLGNLSSVQLLHVDPHAVTAFSEQLIEIGGQRITMQSVDEVITATQRIDIGSLGGGIAARDGATGEGYILYSQRPLSERLSMMPGTADHLIAVTFDDGQWRFDNNGSYLPFIPEVGDLLIAEVDFGANVVTPLINESGVVHGIASGYLRGDVAFFPEIFSNRPNAGEFGVQGTFVERPVDTVRQSLGDLGGGIAARDQATGTGYLMLSVESVHQRFSHLLAGTSQHLTPVVFQHGQWLYDSNGSLRPFTPRESDTLIAEIDFSANTIQGLEGALSVVHGIAAGYLHGDAQFFAEQFGGNPNAGEFEVTGSYVETAARNAAAFDVGDLRGGVVARDIATGEGYLLFSLQRLQDRLPDIMEMSAEHFVAVVDVDGHWHYDNNGTLQPLEIRETDRLVAAIDFSNNSIVSLEGKQTVIGGVQAGYIGGDLQFAAERFGGRQNAGEFEVLGTYFEAPVAMNTYSAGPLGGGIAANDGATGAAHVFYSQQSLFERFADGPVLGNADHFFSGFYSDGQWYFDNNGRAVAFSPRDTDRILADVDYATDSIVALDGRLTDRHGVRAGYALGDLEFIANMFGNSAQDGEFRVLGTYFRTF